MTHKNLPSGSKVVSSTKLKEGRARDKVAMVTKTRQMKRPQLTMVTVPIPGPVPYLHVDGNPICTLLQGPWATCNAFSPRGAQEPGRCCGLLRLLFAAAVAAAAAAPERESARFSLSPVPTGLNPDGIKTVSQSLNTFANTFFLIIGKAFHPHLSVPGVSRGVHKLE